MKNNHECIAGKTCRADGTKDNHGYAEGYAEGRQSVIDELKEEQIKLLAGFGYAPNK
jgi:hypothetical protein